MRGVVEEALAFVQGLVDEAEVPLLEIAQAPVDHLGRLRRRPRGEVGPLHQRRGQAPGGGVEGHAAARDPAPDDEDVEVLGAQPLDGLGPVEGASEGRGASHGASLPQPTWAAARHPLARRSTPRSAPKVCQRATYRQ